MTITLLLLLSAGLLVMAYLLCTLHSRIRLIERMDAQRKREARDLSKMQGEVEHYFSFVSGQQHKILVSIHAPWEGCDRTPWNLLPSSASFNSRTLGRVRLDWKMVEAQAGLFQFTHPGKGATRQRNTQRM